VDSDARCCAGGAISIGWPVAGGTAINAAVAIAKGERRDFIVRLLSILQARG
jgi:hypothetical protein